MLSRLLTCMIVVFVLAIPLFYVLTKHFYAEDSLLYEMECVLEEEPNTTFRDFYDNVGCMYSEVSRESQRRLFDFAKK